MKKNRRFKRDRVFHKSESIFWSWLHKNIDRFYYKPVHNGDGTFYFDGIIKNIILYIDFNQPEAGLILKDLKNNKVYDYYTIQYIGEEKFHPAKGFYDADRANNIYTYYNTYKGLIVTEVYEEIINYCDKYFKKENSLYLVDWNGLAEGFIASNDEKNISEIELLKLKKHSKYIKCRLFLS